MAKRITVALLSACLLISLSACAPSVVPEEDEPLSYHVGMARAYYRLGDYPKAIEMYSKALEMNPSDAEVCLQLGIMYQDNLKDMEKAAVYYREFLRLSPDSEKATLVREWLDSSMKALSTPVPVVPRPVKVTPVPVVAQKIKPVQTRVVAPQNKKNTPQRKGPPAFGTYTVVKGDTLAGISEKFYGTRAEWKRIFEANRDTLKAPEKLKIGQDLHIPPLN